MASSPLPPSGFRDFLPQDCLLRGKTRDLIARSYRSFGFWPISTPAVENLSLLMGKGGGENEKLIFKILKRGEELKDAAAGAEADLGLRYDLTVPLARYYARHKGALPQPFKAYQIGPVWRAERAQKGRYREFLQCDIDVIGSPDTASEIEVIQAAVKALSDLGLEGLTVLLNDRSLAIELLKAAGVGPELAPKALVLIDKQDKMSPAEHSHRMRELLGEEAARAAGLAFSSLEGVKALAEALPGAALEALERVLSVRQTLASLHPSVQFEFKPSLVRGLDYYTGLVFEVRHPGLSSSLAGGGRYDGLIEKIVSAEGDSRTPAFGGSIGFERLVLLLEERSSGNGAVSGPAPRPLSDRRDKGWEAPDVCVTVFSQELLGPSLELARELRGKGISVDLCPLSGRLKTQFKYADFKSARYAAVLGPEERSAGRVKLKDLGTGAETIETPSSLAERLSR